MSRALANILLGARVLLVVQHYNTFDNGNDTDQVTFSNSDGNGGSFKYYELYGVHPISDKYPIKYKMFDYIIHHR